MNKAFRGWRSRPNRPRGGKARRVLMQEVRTRQEWEREQDGTRTGREVEAVLSQGGSKVLQHLTARWTGG